MSTKSILAAPERDRRAIDPSSGRTEHRAVNRAAVARATRNLLIVPGADLDSNGLRATSRASFERPRILASPSPGNDPADDRYARRRRDRSRAVSTCDDMR
jgi:hypothetical protein